LKEWKRLGIGFSRGDTHPQFLAFPCPSDGDPINLSKAIVLPLRGNRWPDVLRCFAESDDGRTARKVDLIYRLGYEKVPLGDQNEAEARAAGLKVEPSVSGRKLSSAMSDLKRKFKGIIQCDDFEAWEPEKKKYKAFFTVGFLSPPSQDGKVRFRQDLSTRNVE
jgi:hypothetical protein